MSDETPILVDENQNGAHLCEKHLAGLEALCRDRSLPTKFAIRSGDSGVDPRGDPPDRTGIYLADQNIGHSDLLRRIVHHRRILPPEWFLIRTNDGGLQNLGLFSMTKPDTPNDSVQQFTSTAADFFVAGKLESEPPLGLRKGSDGRLAAGDSAAIQVVQFVFACFTKRMYTRTELCNLLNAAQAPRPGKRRTWRTESVDILLQDCRYIGAIILGGIVRHESHEPILARGVFEQAADLLSREKAATKRTMYMPTTGFRGPRKERR